MFAKFTGNSLVSANLLKENKKQNGTDVFL